MATQPKSKFKIPSARSEDQPASRKLVYLVRDELKADIRRVETRLETKMDAGFSEVKTEMSQLRSEMTQMQADLKAELKADLFRMQILLEEQHSNNRIVLEGLQALWQRQDRIEQRIR